jgi:hypothetical protein
MFDSPCQFDGNMFQQIVMSPSVPIHETSLRTSRAVRRAIKRDINPVICDRHSVLSELGITDAGVVLGAGDWQLLLGLCWVLGNESVRSATRAGSRMLWCSARHAYVGFTGRVVVLPAQCQ